MKVPLVDLKAQFRVIGKEVREALDGILETQNFIGGPPVAEFEKEFSSFISIILKRNFLNRQLKILPKMLAIVSPNNEASI